MTLLCNFFHMRSTNQPTITGVALAIKRSDAYGPKDNYFFLLVLQVFRAVVYIQSSAKYC